MRGICLQDLERALTVIARQKWFWALFFLAFALGLSALLFLYYTHIHHARMDPYPIKVEGRNAYWISLSIAMPAVYLIRHACLAISDWPDLFTPTKGKILAAFLVFLVTPIGNLMNIPMPAALMLVSIVMGAFTPDFAVPMLLPMGLAYAATSLAWRSGVRPRGAFEIIPAYLWTVYASGVLFLGISYI